MVDFRNTAHASSHSSTDFHRLLLVLGILTAFAIQASAQDFFAPPGAPAKIFPKPQRPVADIVGPIWYGEKERDAARKPSRWFGFSE